MAEKPVGQFAVSKVCSLHIIPSLSLYPRCISCSFCSSFYSSFYSSCCKSIAHMQRCSPSIKPLASYWLVCLGQAPLHGCSWPAPAILGHTGPAELLSHWLNVRRQAVVEAHACMACKALACRLIALRCSSRCPGPHLLAPILVLRPASVTPGLAPLSSFFCWPAVQACHGLLQEGPGGNRRVWTHRGPFKQASQSCKRSMGVVRFKPALFGGGRGATGRGAKGGSQG